MAKRTAGVQELVIEVLAQIPQPYSEDVTDRVCSAIERNPEWLNRYRQLVAELSRDVVNKWIGQHVKAQVGGRATSQAPASSSLIRSYSKLGY